jgi:uncharacterized metal-binding protein
LAKGRTHDLINLAVLPPLIYYLHPSDFISFSAGYFIGTFFLTPDNDLYLSRPNSRWKFLKFIWLPYTKLFSHRGISHIPIYGTITKIFYLSFIAFIFLFLLKVLINFLISDDNFQVSRFDNLDLRSFLNNVSFLSFFFGLILAEFVHIFTDIIYSSFKKLKPKRKRRK